MTSKYFVYIVECSDKTLYTGCTNNLKKRLNEHNKSKGGAHYTKIRRPVILKYFEEFPTLKQAMAREAEIKRLSRKKKLALVQNKQARAQSNAFFAKSFKNMLY